MKYVARIVGTPYTDGLDAEEDAAEVILTDGNVKRGVKWVYPSPDDHRPATHFPPGKEIYFYEFRSASRHAAIMSRDRELYSLIRGRSVSLTGGCMSFSEPSKSDDTFDVYVSAHSSSVTISLFESELAFSATVSII